jgi:adenine deaminase
MSAGKIVDIRTLDTWQDQYLLPGFVDAHIHIESSMLTPSEFARAAVGHGTVATISDPHEIANVLGVAGVHYMLEDAASCPLKIFFGAPSCVPATEFETAGGRIDAEQVAQLLADPRIGYLSEVMNVPGVLSGESGVARKIQAALSLGKPIDGHAPGVRGADAARYFAAGISTDHECVALDEAREKLGLGAKILIREGSAARNFEALYPLLLHRADDCMLCSDDLHPDELLHGHIDRLVRRAIEQGADTIDVLRTASLVPIRHYGIDVGLLQVGDDADFLVVDDLQTVRVRQTYIRGQLVAVDGRPCFERRPSVVVNRFQCQPLQASDLRVPATTDRLNVIEAIDGQLHTRRLVVPARIVDSCVVADPASDVLKLVVVNRYQRATPAVCFIRGFGMQRGAIASSVAHDCHNIIAVGTCDTDLCTAINLVIEHRGGLAAVGGADRSVLPLPVAGLMSTESFEQVARQYLHLNQLAQRFGSTLSAPFMTLSFMALLVIPELKLSDRGLFDGGRFRFISLFA